MVNFYLATPRREKSPINISIAFRGKQYRRTTRESTLVKFWNPQRQRVRVCLENRSANRTNDILEQWYAAAVKAVAIFKVRRTPPTTQELFAEVDKEFYGPEPPSTEVPTSTISPAMSFTDYFRSYIARYDGTRSLITIKHYRTTWNKLRSFEQQTRCKLTFEDIGIDFYNRFRAWIYAQNYSDNYFGSLVKVIKQVYREARDVDGLHNLNGTAHKSFITVAKESDPIFLTTEELMRLSDLELSDETIAAEWPELKDPQAIKRRIETCKLVRNRFLIGAFSGLRVSDFSHLSSENIVNGRIVLRTRKTDTPIVLPIHPVIQNILGSGFELKKTISDQQMNTYIKRLAKMAQIDEKVAVREFRGGVPRTRVIEKYELVTTHTARRSFATNLLKAKDVPLAAISKALGHSKITTTMRYLRIGAEDNAAILAQSSYFNPDKSR